MKRIAFTSICIGLFALSSFAQVNKRRENQQDRIAQGVQSGQLSPGETASLENQERALNGEVRADRKANDGKLTSAERKQINRQQNVLSHEIYRDKHNTASDHFGKSEVGKRQENQQDRIAQGIKSGTLNPGETARLEDNQTAINQEVRADRRLNGGKLTNAERRQVNRQLNRQSRNIYRAKH
jgi:hypothetical protein